MKNNTIITTLSDLTKGVLYFSESESPFVVGNWGKVPPADLSGKIATKHAADANQLKVLDPKAFFDRIVAKADPADLPTVENAQKIYAFYEYAQKNLSNLQVTRVEGDFSIPIAITGYLPDGTCIVIQTQAVET
jgi:hypothetical protein